MIAAWAIIEMGKPLRSDGDVERKSVKERDGHFTARGQRARYTVADCAPIVVCGSRPAFVDLRGTLRDARARPVLSRPTRGWGHGHFTSRGNAIRLRLSRHKEF